MTRGGRPSTRTGQVGILNGPLGWSITCMMPRFSKLGSFCSSIVSKTAPAGTPTPLIRAIASSLVCLRVHSVTIASTSASFASRAAPVL